MFTGYKEIKVNFFNYDNKIGGSSCSNGHERLLATLWTIQLSLYYKGLFPGCYYM